MIAAIRDEIVALSARLRQTIATADQASLDWRPAPDTSSLAVLAIHTAGSVEYLVGTAAGENVPRDRDAEFRAAQTDKSALLARLDEVDARVRRWLEGLNPSSLGEKRTLRTGEQTAAYCIVHAAAHLAEHVAHTELTYQLWSQSNGR